MALKRAFILAALLVAMAVPLLQQEQPQAHCAEPPKPPPNCPPGACAVPEPPGPMPEDPCGGMYKRIQELEAQIEEIEINIAAALRVLEAQHGRAITNAELNVFDGVTALVGLPAEVAASGGKVLVRVATWAGKELLQKAAEGALKAGVGSLFEPISRDALEGMDVDTLDDLVNDLTTARHLAAVELRALRDEYKECSEGALKAYNAWAAKRDDYEFNTWPAFVACMRKYTADYEECVKYYEQVHAAACK